MDIFTKRPKLRCVFVIPYCWLSLRLLVDNFALLNFIPAVFILAGSYIALAKATVINSPRVECIDDLKFDILSSLVYVYLVVDLIVK